MVLLNLQTCQINLTDPVDCESIRFFKPVFNFFCLQNAALADCCGSVLLCYFSAAVEALRRKKRLERQLQGVLGAVNAVKFQIEALQSARLNKHILATLQSGSREHKRAHKEM